MTVEAFFTPPPAVSVSDSLLIALFIACVMHVLIILGVNFSLPRPEKINKSIHITIANMPSQTAPEKAQYLAQENQQGAGSIQKKAKPPAHTIPSQGKVAQKSTVQSRSKSKPKPVKKVITQKQSTAEPINSEEQQKTKAQKNLQHISTDSLARQVAQLGAEIRYKQQSEEQSRIKFLNSVSTHKYLASQYIIDWQNKVEKTGNLNYPEIARKKHITGRLTMDVGINHDGSIYSIRVNKSSGYPTLDNAAKRIVRMSAPFAPLPKELRKELDVLIITRVWKFSDESGMSAQ